MSRSLRRLLVALGIFVVVVAGLIVTAYGILQTSWAHGRIASMLGEALSGEGRTVTVGSVGGHLPGGIILRNVVVSDGDGAWARIGEMNIVWQPWRLLFDTAEVRTFSVSAARLDRLPKTTPTETQGNRPAGSLHLPDIGIDVAAVSIDMMLGPALTDGNVEQLHASGSARYGMGNGIHLNLDATQGGAAGSRLTTRIHANPEDETLELDMHAHEALGGLVSRLLGLEGDGPFDIDVNGDGTLMDWHGTAKAMLGPHGQLDAKIDVAGKNRPRFSITGTATTPPFLTGRLEEVAAPPYDFDIHFSIDDRTEITFASTTIKSAGAKATADGTIKLSDGSVDLTVKLQPADASVRSALLAPLSAPSLAVNAQIRGYLSAPFIEASAVVPALSGEKLSAGRTNLMAELDFDTGDPATLFTFDASATVARLAFMRESSPSDPPSDVLIRTKGAYHGTIERLSFGDLTMRSDWASLNFAGGLNLGDEDASKMNGRLNMELRGLPFGGPALAQFLKEPARLQTSFVYLPEGERLRLAALSLNHPKISAQGDVEIGFNPQSMRGKLTARIGDVRPFADLFGVDLAGGPVDLALATAPAGSAVNSTLTAAADQLTVSGTRLRAIKAALVLKDVETQAGTLDIAFTGPAGAVKATTGIARSQNPDRLALNNLKLTAAGGELQGNLVIPLDHGVATGSASGQFAALDAVSTLIGKDINGAAKFSVVLSDIGGQQGVTGHLEANDISAKLEPGHAITVKRITVETGGDITRLARGVPFTVAAEGVSTGEVGVDSLSMTGSTNFRRADYKIVAKGTYRGNVTLSATGSADWGEPIRTLRLGSLTATHGATPVQLIKPAVVMLSDDGVEVMPTTIEIGDGRLDLSLKRGNEALQGHLDATDLPLNVTRIFTPDGPAGGTLSGTADIDVSAGRQTGSAKFSIADLAMSARGDGANRLSGTLEANWRQENLDLKGQFANQNYAEIQISASMPVHFQPDTSSFRVPADGRLRGDITWNAEVGPFWNAFGPDTQTLQGHADASLKLGGTVSDPIVTGDIALHDGRYVDQEMGTVLEKLALKLSADRHQIRLIEASATDGGSGKISANGSIDLDKDEGFPIRFDVTADKAKLVRRTDVTIVASGQLSFIKQGKSSVLQGSIKTDDVNAILVDLSNPDVVKLDVTEIGADGTVLPPRQEEEVTVKPNATKLDVAIDVPGHAFIRGRGLDSEWHGKLTATGTVEDPQLVGTFEVTRGNFKFAGRNFDLQRGQVSFQGGNKIDPDLNIQAVYQVQDLTATVNVTGPSSAPKVSLSSTPTYPQDEILSRILFGSSVADLTPLQAVQLADAIRGLGKPGGGLLGSARSAVGLDVLQIGSAQPGGGVESTTITGGKYLTKNVYVEVETAPNGGQEKVGVNVNLTKHLSVQSDVSPQEGSRVGLKWKRDY